jgi:hypothetical protein
MNGERLGHSRQAEVTMGHETGTVRVLILFSSTEESTGFVGGGGVSV